MTVVVITTLVNVFWVLVQLLLSGPPTCLALHQQTDILETLQQDFNHCYYLTCINKSLYLQIKILICLYRETLFLFTTGRSMQ